MHQFLVEGLVIKRLFEVRDRVTAEQSDQARLERYPPDRRVVGFWTCVRGRRPAPPSCQQRWTADIELMLPFSVYKAATIGGMTAAFQSMPSQTHNKGKRLAADQTDNVTSPLSHNFQKLGIVNSQYVVTWDPLTISNTSTTAAAGGLAVLMPCPSLHPLGILDILYRYIHRE